MWSFSFIAFRDGTTCDILLMNSGFCITSQDLIDRSIDAEWSYGFFFFFFWSVWQNWQKNLKRKIDLFNSNLFGEKNKKAGFKLSQVGRTQQFSHVLDYKGYHFLKPTTSHIIFYFLEFGFRDRKAKVVDSTQYFWVHLILKLFLLSVWLILLRLLEWASITVHSCLQLCTWVLSG